MHSSGDATPKKGAGYFAGRLKEKIGIEEPKPAQEASTTPESQDKVSPDIVQTAP